MKEFPKVGFGTWRIGAQDVEQAITTAIEAGYKHIDTAQIYNNEYQIGEVLEKLGKNNGEIFITTKVWPNNYRLFTYKSVEESIRRLRIKKIDLMLLHAPLSAKHAKDLITAYKELIKARENGLVDRIGVSNFNIELLELIKKETGEYPDNNQMIFSPTTILEDVETFCKDKGISLTGYSIIRSYFSPHPRYKDISMTDAQKQRVDELAAKYNKDVGQVLSKWALQQGYHIIPKSITPSRIKSNILLDDFELTQQEIEELRSWNVYTTEKMFNTFSSFLENGKESYEEITAKGLLFEKNFNKK